MKLLFSIDHLYLHGGAEKVLTHRVNYLAEKLGCEVTIITTEQKGKQTCYTLSDKVKLIDLEINYYREKSYFHPSNLLKIPNHFKKLNKTIKKINPDAVIVLNYAFDYYWLPFIVRKIPKLKEFHSSRYYPNEARKKANLLKKFFLAINDFVESNYDRIVVLNPTESFFYKNKNIEVIPNPITITDKLVDITSKNVMAAGRIAPIKGFEKLIEAWEIVAPQYPDWKLNIYGQGEEQYINSLQELINQKKLEKHIIFQPATDNLIEKMTQHSIFVMSSISECFPMVLLESLSVGLPIISFDCPTGPGNIITANEDGILVENQNSETLAEKIVFLISHQDSRKDMSEKGKHNVKRFSEEVIMKKWFEMLTNITSKK